MQAVRDYALGIGTAAIICGITLCFGGKGSTAPLLKLICGLVLTFSAVNPILAISARDWDALGISVQSQAREAAEEGQRMARASVAENIKEDTEAYIEERTSSLGLEVHASISLSRDSPPVPDSVTIIGDLSPYDRRLLSRMLTQELGISEDRQLWK